jgi:kynureninase
MTENSAQADSAPCIYLCGNSLGLQPKRAREFIQKYLGTWATKGVYGHFKRLRDAATAPWVDVDDQTNEAMAKIVGAQADEVAVMQTLTANLHFLMASFYRPTKERHRIIIEGKAFPSDHVCSPSQHLNPLIRSMLIHLFSTPCTPNSITTTFHPPHP